MPLDEIALVWDDEKGYGYFPVDKYLEVHKQADPYDQAYFKKYEGYAATELGRKITDFRLKTVNKLTNGLVVDIGIGSGQFVEERNRLGKPTHGHDINPLGIKWLQEKGWHANLLEPVEVMTFWDCLEHIQDPKPLLSLVTRFVVVSIPIFTDYKSVINSKHYRKTEHYHYWNHMGFVSWCWSQGLRLVEYSDAETELGREGIRTFIFRRAA